MTKSINFITLLFIFFSGFVAKAQSFDLGPGESQFKWGREIPLPENAKTDFNLRVGTRLQAQMEDVAQEDFMGNSLPSTQDFFVRRARFQVKAKFQQNLSFYMDIRADKVDKGIDGDNSFELGDVFFQAKDLFGSDSLRLRLFRAKYDISRMQTVSSSRLMILNRASITDYASDYISKARRGTNIQLLTNWSDKVSTQWVLGDSLAEGSFRDAVGENGATLNRQSLAYGVRLRVSPFAGWEEGKLTETYFGQGQHLAFGAGYFGVNNIHFDTNNTGSSTEIDRALTNFDLSMHYGPFSLQAEYFRFDGVVESFAQNILKIGRSDGWFIQSEFVLTELNFIAPFVRYQYWNRFLGKADFAETSFLAGANYYLKGNKFRVGASFEKINYGEGLAVLSGFSKQQTTISMNLMMHY